jgi:DNA-binding transcriptional LysR family regulator
MPALALPNLSARQLLAILALAENRSFIAAAAALKVSQPALTRTVKQVELVLGVELFSRTTRQVTTTIVGKEFVALAERLLNDLRIGVDSLRQHSGQGRGQVIVSSVLQLSDSSLPELIVNYRRQFAGIDLQLREGMLGHVLDDVRSGVADFGVAYVNSVPDTFAVEALGVEALHVVLPVKHELARRTKIYMKDLKDVTWVSYPVDARTRRLVDSMAATAGFAPRHAITVNRVSTLMSMVRYGVGIAIVPSSERPLKSDRAITSRPLSAAQISRLGIIRLRERELTPAAAAFLAVVKQWVRLVAPQRLRSARRS